MLTRVFIFLIGFGLLLIGSVYMISYLNLLTIGYNFFDYVKFIINRLECYYFLIGLILIIISIYFMGGEKYELYL